jgi:hypothetical protein
VLYFAVGLAWLTWRGLALVSRRDWADHSLAANTVPADAPGERHSIWREPRLYALLAGLLLLGLALPALEVLIPPRYATTVQAQMLAAVWAAEEIPAAERAALQRLLDEPGNQVLAGRALYPRFYPAGVGEQGSFNPMRSLPVSRLGFYLAGPQTLPVLLALDASPAALPNGADVLVFVGADQRLAAVAVFDEQLQFRELLP